MFEQEALNHFADQRSVAVPQLAYHHGQNDLAACLIAMLKPGRLMHHYLQSCMVWLLGSSMEKLEEVDEFILPDIEPLASLICPERLEYPDMFELGDVVPTDNINVYDAFLRPYFPFSMPVSFVVMSNLADACCLERRMRHVASIVGKDFVLGTKLVVNYNPEIDTGFSHHCLVTERIPEQTVAMFLNGNPPLSVNKEFFKLLWSALSKLHDVGNYFGNLRYGVRVVNNKPILTFPARRVFRDHGYERGVENDLVNVISWAIEAFSDLVIELRCFLSICRDVVPVRNCTVARTIIQWPIYNLDARNFTKLIITLSIYGQANVHENKTSTFRDLYYIPVIELTRSCNVT
ncbi:hypothetical protein POM88_005628 [Heracleum sosnowskyi]|uniref:Uncharacterized protein n=1 Tax=Heracleum sosnowskyi TaxID=360622 RepID=A0AAD8J118_9APIA|nr:hypothetical protein POM88_005628 [Heracleum sosnowskyi]